MVERWFKPKKHSGWKKNQTATTRRRHLLAATPKNWTMHHRRLSAGRKAQALANVTTDYITNKKAQTDANYFFRNL